MSSTFRQAALIAVGGVGLGATAVVLARRRLMTLRYALGWMAIAVLAIVAASLASLVTPIAKLFNMTGTAVFLTGASVVFLAIAIQLSISVSGLQAQMRELVEQQALLTARVDGLEQPVDRESITP